MSEITNMNDIASNLETVEKKIRAACERSGRKRESVTLIAVSKTKPLSDIEAAYLSGCTQFGENKVQELMEKQKHCSLPLSWHLIGHLQINKVKYLPGAVKLIHSVDSEKLAAEIDRQAAKHGVVMDVLCEINIASEESKFGILPEQAVETVKRIATSFGHVSVKGLMCVAPRTDDAKTNRPYFRAMRQLLESINGELGEDKRLSEFSMGMSGDFETAIEEGATMVRVGTGIFGKRDYEITA